MEQKGLEKLNKEKLIIYAYENCDGMVLKDEMLKAEMISEIMSYTPEEIEEVIEEESPSGFDEWYLVYLQEFTDKNGVETPHHPDCHGCLGAQPSCELCDPCEKSPREIFDES